MTLARDRPVSSRELIELLAQLVPLVGTFGLHNHLGGLHAGAPFTLGESASGAIVVAALAERLDEITPLVAEATVPYHRLARGDVRAGATADTSAGVLSTDGRTLKAAA